VAVISPLLTWTLDEGCPTRGPTGCAVRPAASFVNHMSYKTRTIIQEVRYTTYCYIWPANKPSLTDMAFCRKNLDSPTLDGEWLVLGCSITGYRVDEFTESAIVLEISRYFFFKS
jgi:hypothetical protein